MGLGEGDHEPTAIRSSGLFNLRVHGTLKESFLVSKAHSWLCLLSPGIWSFVAVEFGIESSLFGTSYPMQIGVGGGWGFFLISLRWVCVQRFLYGRVIKRRQDCRRASVMQLKKAKSMGGCDVKTS